MTILVTGANGFVGQHLIRELTSHDHTVLALGLSATSPFEDQTHVSYLSFDLTDAEAAKSLDFNGIDGVIHLAGLAAVGPSFSAPMQYVQTNVGIEINLFEAALAQKATPRFLIISSGSLYDSKAKLPLNESSSVLPNSPYAVSKLAQEYMALYYGERGFPCIIARPFNHIGPGQGSGFIAPDLAQEIIACERGEKDTLLVGNLDAQRDYTDVRDIVRAYRLLIESGTAGQSYALCSGTPTSGQQLLQGLLAHSSATPSVEQDSRKMRPADSPIIYGDHAKLTRDTGWQPEIPLETTLADTLAYWRAQP
jgi:GDP-4-dehydro-6-deoxy-D-mannose reductase